MTFDETWGRGGRPPHGAFDYVVKPVDMNYLDQSLQTALAMVALD